MLRARPLAVILAAPAPERTVPYAQRMTPVLVAEPVDLC